MSCQTNAGLVFQHFFSFRHTAEGHTATVASTNLTHIQEANSAGRLPAMLCIDKLLENKGDIG